MTKNGIVLLNLAPGMSFSYRNKGVIYPSTATLLLGTVLNDAGYEIHIIDGAYDENYLTKLRDILKAKQILFVGMTVMTTQVPLALKASIMVKKLPLPKEENR